MQEEIDELNKLLKELAGREKGVIETLSKFLKLTEKIGENYEKMTPTEEIDVLAIANAFGILVRSFSAEMAEQLKKSTKEHKKQGKSCEFYKFEKRKNNND